MSVITAFAAAVPTDRREAYAAHLRESAVIFKESGARRCVECWGSDVPEGTVTSFPMAVKAEPGETVVFGFVEWPDQAAYDAGMPKAMAAMREGIATGAMASPPFDGKRLIFGVFDVLIDL